MSSSCFLDRLELTKIDVEGSNREKAIWVSARPPRVLLRPLGAPLLWEEEARSRRRL